MAGEGGNGGGRPPVRLREVTEDDLPLFFEQQRDPVAHRMAAFTSWDPEDRDRFDGRWRRMLVDESVVTRAILVDESVAGHIAKFEMDGRAEVTYWLGRAYWGLGVASAALRVFLDEVEVRPLYGRAARDNVGSVRVLEKCGFRLTGYVPDFAKARGEEIDEAILVLE